MATLDSFYPYILPDVQGCPEPTIDVAIRSAAIEFCEKSLAFQRDLDPVTVVKNIIDYDLEPPDQQLVVRIMRMWFKGTELHPVAPDFVSKPEIYNSLFSGADKSASDPRHYIQKDERTFTLYPIPPDTVANALTMRVALKPSRSATTIEDDLFEEYAEVIAHGAKFRLLSMASKPWTNGPAASASLTLFNNGINAAMLRGYRGGTRAGLRVQMRSI
jgi:hypothetical protein